MEAERDKDNHGRASEIFSGSMASGSYLLSDGAADRLKLPLSLCQEENAQLYFPTEETEAAILCGRQLFGADAHWTVQAVKACCCFLCSVFCSSVFCSEKQRLSFKCHPGDHRKLFDLVHYIYDSITVKLHRDSIQSERTLTKNPKH